jgi:heme/copper-type cytochrome/quinol oxidase subunit 3
VRAARREQLNGTRLWLLLAVLLGAAMLVVRWLEIKALPFRWDANAQASTFYVILGLHVTHVLTSVLEDLMMVGLFFIGPVEKKHYGDVEASALLWYFSVLEWAPAFALLYLEPLLHR